MGDSDALIDFVRAMHVKGLNDKGEYVVIAVEEKPYDPEGKLEYFTNCKWLFSEITEPTIARHWPVGMISIERGTSFTIEQLPPLI